MRLVARPALIGLLLLAPLLAGLPAQPEVMGDDRERWRPTTESVEDNSIRRL